MIQFDKKRFKIVKRNTDNIIMTKEKMSKKSIKYVQKRKKSKNEFETKDIP